MGHFCLCLHTGTHTEKAGLLLVCFKSSWGHNNLEYSYHISGNASLKESLFLFQGLLRGRRTRAEGQLSGLA